MRVLALALLAVPVLGYAKSHHAPLPDELSTAKTVYLVNNTGEQKVVDIAYDQLSRWGRFRVVTNKANADLVVVFDRGQSNFHEGTTYSLTRMDVFVNGQDEAVYEATERFRPTLFGNSSVKECIGDFKHRLESN